MLIETSSTPKCLKLKVFYLDGEAILDCLMEICCDLNLIPHSRKGRLLRLVISIGSFLVLSSVVDGFLMVI